MNSVYQMAKKYYPEKWNRAQVDHLYEIGRLTEEEYNDIIDENNGEASLEG